MVLNGTPSKCMFSLEGTRFRTLLNYKRDPYAHCYKGSFISPTQAVAHFGTTKKSWGNAALPGNPVNHITQSPKP